MVFYQILQYGQHCCSHHDKMYYTEKQLKEVCRRIVLKAKSSVQSGDMQEGQFDVKICDEKGNEIGSFISGTDYTY